MFEIRNKENKRQTINLMSGTIDLLGKSTAVVSDEDFSSSQLQNLLRSGKVILVSRKEDKSTNKWTPKKVGLSKKEVSEPEEKIESEISDYGGTDEPEVIEPEVIESEIRSEESPVTEKLVNEPKGVKEKERKKTGYNKRN